MDLNALTFQVPGPLEEQKKEKQGLCLKGNFSVFFTLLFPLVFPPLFLLF